VQPLFFKQGLGMNWLDYREKLGIGFNDTQKADMFKSKLHALFALLKPELDIRKVKENFVPYFSMVGETPSFCDYSDLDYVVNSITRESDMPTMISKMIAFIHVIDKCYDSDSRNIESLKRIMQNSLLGFFKVMNIQYDIIEDADGVFIFPKGAQELDNALISQPLEWLKKYPNSYKTYCIALRQYSEGVYIRDVADNLRKALEDFLREFLENEKDLNSNKKEAEAYLKRANAAPQLVSLFGALLTHYYLLNNDIAKHNDKVDKTYLEFLLYQTGIFIRTLIVVRQEKEEAPHAD